MVKVVCVGEIQLNSGFETNISCESTVDQSKTEAALCESMNNDYSMSANVKRHSVIVQSLSHNRHNQISPDNLERISSSKNKTNILDFPNNSSTDTYEKKKQSHPRKCGIFPSFKLCCCCLTCAALLLIGLIVTIVTLLVLRHPKNTMPIANTTTASSTTATTTSVTATTISTTATTTVTTVSTPFTTTITSTATTTTTITENEFFTEDITTSNLVVNGDGETGACESGAGVTHPTGWTYNGTITQIYYNNTNGDQFTTDPGPSDRGKCYFCGQISAVTSMWQTVNMTSSINPVLIDNQTVSFNFSAWIGGYSAQDDNAQVSLTFINQANQKVGSSFTLGPVLAAARGSITSLLFRQTNGLVPVGARSFIVMVTITRVTGTYSDGNVDNIALYLYQ